MGELLAVFAVAVALAGGVVAGVINRRGLLRYQERLGTIGSLLRECDQEELRRIKQDEGELSAVIQLRREVPEVPLADARRLVRLL
jgi:hypothetical protein